VPGRNNFWCGELLSRIGNRQGESYKKNLTSGGGKVALRIRVFLKSRGTERIHLEGGGKIKNEEEEDRNSQEGLKLGPS